MALLKQRLRHIVTKCFNKLKDARSSKNSARRTFGFNDHKVILVFIWDTDIISEKMNNLMSENIFRFHS